jgi:hypothetical protein
MGSGNRNKGLTNMSIGSAVSYVIQQYDIFANAISNADVLSIE